MNKLKVFDVARMVIDDAEEQFGSRWMVSEPHMKALEMACADVDVLIDEFEFESTDVSIDDEMHVVISAVCFDMVFDNQGTGTFFSLIRKATGFSFRAENHNVKVTFVLPGVFVRKQ